LETSVELIQTIYKNFQAIEMRSSQIRLIVVPELGGKIVSLLHLPSGKEWLCDSGPRQLRKVEYGSDFMAADMSGWDECFPTIVQCAYPDEGRYNGTHIPDHGGVWCMPWQQEVVQGALKCAVAGLELPYRLTRTISFSAADMLSFEYEATNNGGESLSVLWAAHPLFAVTERTRICLPPDQTKVLCVDGGKSLTANRLYEWPRGDTEQMTDIDLIGAMSRRDSRKFYADGQVTTGWAGLYERDSGECLTLSWSPDELPYLGIWIHEGRFNDQLVCALEPCNGYYDSLDEAAKRGTALRIEPGQTARWRLDIKLGQG